jgi:DNA-binding HxlR family transcriptional regulator
MYETVRAVVEPKWSLEILATLAAESPQNFSQIERQFDTSNDVITARLRLLVEYELVERSEYTVKDVRYSVTERGEATLELVEELETLLETQYSPPPDGHFSKE